jgi:hypothetical protein
MHLHSHHGSVDVFFLHALLIVDVDSSTYSALSVCNVSLAHTCIVRDSGKYRLRHSNLFGVSTK